MLVSQYNTVEIFLRAPRAAHDALTEMVEDVTDGWNDWVPAPRAASVRRALDASLPGGYKLDRVEVKAIHVELDPGWEGELREIARGQDVHNQAVGVKDPRMWGNMFRFRSATEVRIAEAFDKTGVMFFPLPLGRLTGAEGQRINQEPDFLVCDSSGNWGILEVDGEPFHKGFAARDRKRDRQFQDNGVKQVERYEADICYNRSNWVVQDFLHRLGR
jgi:hypothetical protein